MIMVFSQLEETYLLFRAKDLGVSAGVRFNCQKLGRRGMTRADLLFFPLGQTACALFRFALGRSCLLLRLRAVRLTLITT